MWWCLAVPTMVKPVGVSTKALEFAGVRWGQREVGRRDGVRYTASPWRRSEAGVEAGERVESLVVVVVVVAAAMAKASGWHCGDQ